eukprot:1921031-Rhodomonas_salina.2
MPRATWKMTVGPLQNTTSQILHTVSHCHAHAHTHRVQPHRLHTVSHCHAHAFSVRHTQTSRGGGDGACGCRICSVEGAGGSG